MELFTKLYGAWLLFSYHCFDRIVISGYLMGLQRCGQVVYWLREVLGVAAVDKAPAFTATTSCAMAYRMLRRAAPAL